jgi:DNA-binding NarL/FixJ family response regulator
MDQFCVTPKMAASPHVFFASNVELVSEGLYLQLSRCDEVKVVGRGRLDDGAIARIGEHRTNVVVLDIASAGASDFAMTLRVLCPCSRLVGIAIGSTSMDVADWAQLGVAGFVDDNGTIDDVVAAIRRVARGEFSSTPRTAAALVTALIDRVERCRPPEGVRRLTPRETQILMDLERGATNKEIARRLGISAATVKNHVHNVLEKLEVNRRQDAGALMRSGRF